MKTEQGPKVEKPKFPPLATMRDELMQKFPYDPEKGFTYEGNRRIIERTKAAFDDAEDGKDASVLEKLYSRLVRKEIPASPREMLSELSMTFHPDKGQQFDENTEELLKQINAAYKEAQDGKPVRLEALYRRRVLGQNVEVPSEEKALHQLTVEDLEKIKDPKARMETARQMAGNVGCYPVIAENILYFAKTLGFQSEGEFVNSLAQYAAGSGQINFLLNNEKLAKSLPATFLESLVRSNNVAAVAAHFRKFQNLPDSVAQAMWENGFQNELVYGLSNFNDQAKQNIINAAFTSRNSNFIMYIFTNLSSLNVKLSAADAANVIKSGNATALYNAFNGNDQAVLSKFPGYTSDQFFMEVLHSSPHQNERDYAANILRKKGINIGPETAAHQ